MQLSTTMTGALMSMYIRRRGLYTAIVMLKLSLIGCNGEEGGEIGRNSMGESRVLWTVSDDVLLSIGAVDGDSESELFGIRGAVRLASGYIAVADRSQRVRVYGQSGELVRTFGGRGNGPSEFAQIRSMTKVGGDSLMVLDLSKVSFIEPYDGVVEARPIERALYGRFSDGSFVAQSVVSGAMQEDVSVLTEITWLRYTTSVGVVDTIGTTGGDQLVYGSGTVYSGGVLGNVDVAVGADRLYVSDPRVFEVRVFDMHGTEYERIVHDVVPISISYEMLEGVASRVLSQVPRRVLPDYQPAIGSILVDDHGMLWVAEYDLSDAKESVWWIFEHSGVLRAKAILPARFRPMHIGDDFVLGVWRDAIDVEYVRMYALRRE